MAKKKGKGRASGRGAGAPAAARRGGKPAPKKAPAKRASARGKAPARRAASRKTSHVAPGYTTVTPTLTLSDCAKAIDFYRQAFGAKELSRFPSPDGKGVMHAELQIGDSRIMVSDPMGPGRPAASAESPSPGGIFLYVPDCDALYAQATQAGAKAVMPVADQFWGDRFGALLDPFGVPWGIATHVRDMTPEQQRKAGEEFFRRMAQGGGSGGGSESPAA